MPLALTLVLLTSATTGITIGTGRSDPLPVGLLMVAGLVGIWLMRMLLIERRFSLKPSPLNFPLLAFLAAALVSWAFGYLLWDWKLPAPQSNLFLVQAGQYVIFALSFLAFFLTAHAALSEKDLQRWVLIISLIGVGGMIFELATGSFQLRARGLTGAVLTWAVVLIGGQLLFNPDFKGYWRLAAGVAMLVFAVWAFRNLSWKGGWVPAVLGLGLLILLRSRKAFLGLVAVAAVIALSQWNTCDTPVICPGAKHSLHRASVILGGCDPVNLAFPHFGFRAGQLQILLGRPEFRAAQPPGVRLGGLESMGVCTALA